MPPYLPRVLFKHLCFKLQLWPHLYHEIHWVERSYHNRKKRRRPQTGLQPRQSWRPEYRHLLGSLNAVSASIPTISLVQLRNPTRVQQQFMTPELSHRLITLFACPQKTAAWLRFQLAATDATISRSEPKIDVLCVLRQHN